MSEPDIRTQLEDIRNMIQRIEDHLGIKPDRKFLVSDLDEFLQDYEDVAINDLKLTGNTVKQRVATLKDYLKYGNKVIDAETVAKYLDRQVSPAMRNNALKALKPLCKEVLSLGNWIDEFEFDKIEPKLKTKKLPDSQDLGRIFIGLGGVNAPDGLLMLLLFCTGLRVNEALKIESNMINWNMRSIDTLGIHLGKTKHSSIVFFTNEWKFLAMSVDYHGKSGKMFPNTSYTTFSRNFIQVSKTLGYDLTPKDLRLMFADNCVNAGMAAKYVDMLQGRLKNDIQSIHYTDYNFMTLSKQYDKVRNSLKLNILEEHYST